MGLFTNLPVRSGKSPYPHQTDVPGGWLSTSGWSKIDSEMTQGESFKVRRPPLPAPLWVRLVISTRNCLPVVVTVNVTQRESAIRGVPKNTSGLPKPLCFSAKDFHNAHDRPG